MKLLCIDYGLARTGLAATDAGGRMAFPRTTLHLDRLGSRKALLAALMEIIAAEQPGALVVGLPLHRDGAESLTTRQVRNFTERLKRRTELPIYFMPEFLSSEEAAADLEEAGMSRARRREVLDQQAAVRILESFLAEPGERRMRA
ncbi:MAG: Holliday junction resolvase RuvX [Desulfovibrionaceae bacterium]|nr:Holliday junction resolvase RuvX [Desulfovibrionaceae bacterium]